MPHYKILRQSRSNLSLDLRETQSLGLMKVGSLLAALQVMDAVDAVMDTDQPGYTNALICVCSSVFVFLTLAAMTPTTFACNHRTGLIAEFAP